MVVAQAAGAGFDVRFLQEHGRAVLLVSSALIFQAPREVGCLLSADASLLETPSKLFVQPCWTGEATGFYERCLANVVLVGVFTCLADRSGGVANLETNIPQCVKDLLD